SLVSLVCVSCLFFFQAEDGIRDFHVTGVQTCALPISITSSTAIATLLTRSASITRTCSELSWVTVTLRLAGQACCSRASSALTEIGRASCRERGWIPAGSASVKKQQPTSAATRGARNA